MSWLRGESVGYIPTPEPLGGHIGVLYAQGGLWAPSPRVSTHGALGVLLAGSSPCWWKWDFTRRRVFGPEDYFLFPVVLSLCVSGPGYFGVDPLHPFSITASLGSDHLENSVIWSKPLTLQHSAFPSGFLKVFFLTLLPIALVEVLIDFLGFACLAFALELLCFNDLTAFLEPPGPVQRYLVGSVGLFRAGPVPDYCTW